MKNYTEVDFHFTCVNYDLKLKEIKKISNKNDIKFFLLFVFATIVGIAMVCLAYGEHGNFDVSTMGLIAIAYTVVIILLVIFLPSDVSLNINIKYSNIIKDQNLKVVEFYKKDNKFILCMENEEHEILKFYLRDDDFDVVYKTNLINPYINFSDYEIVLPYEKNN